MKFRDKLQNFMYGRNGADELSRDISILSLVLILLSLFTKIRLLNYLAFAALIYCYIRMFSKDIYKRAEENRRYLEFKENILNKFRREKDHASQLKEYRFFKCPVCKQKVRVPRGKGKIKIHCPRCQNDFIKKS